MTEPTRESRRENPSWAEWVSEDPTRSQWYVDRIRAMAARGDDLGGEARLATRSSRPAHAFSTRVAGRDVCPPR